MSAPGHEVTELTPDKKMRLALAGRIAAGMAANGEAYEMKRWQGEIAIAAWDVAGKLMSLAIKGGF
jgi:hypothetical protein